MSSSSSTSYRRYNRNQDVTHKTHCDCDPPHPIPIQTAWTIDNPGRRFRGCPIHDKSKKCGVYGFLDQELPSDYYKSLVYNLHEENKALKKMNKVPGVVMEDSSKGFSNKSNNENDLKADLSFVKSKLKVYDRLFAVASAVNSAMTAMFKQHQVTPAPASFKSVEESCVYFRCYQAPTQQTQVTTSSELEEFKKTNEASIQAMRNHIGSLPSNTIANPKGELKAITTRSGIVLDGTSVPMPPPFINLEEDERAEDMLTDPELTEDPLHLNIPYPSRMYKEKQQDKDEIQIHKFWKKFKQLHINITLADALILIPKYQKMLKALLSNKEKLLELVNTPLNENYSTVILKKLPEKLGDPGKFLILYGFSKLKCKALADLGAIINLMPHSVWKKLGLSELISTRMTLELATWSVYTLARIAKDVFVLVGRFTFPTNFVIVNYESDPQVPLILERPFLRTARALIDMHEEELILRDGDKRLILNMNLTLHKLF
ncbi:reverse transcriptase domain-containing protein [Tanacetum coccineum]